MRYFLIYILSALPFFALSQVILPDSVARFYMDRHFLAKNLQERNDFLILLLDIQEETINKQDSLIKNYDKSQAVHSILEDNFRLQIEAGTKENRAFHKKIREQRLVIVVISIIFTLITL